MNPRATIRGVLLYLTFALSASAMVLSDSRVLSLSEMQDLGVQVEAIEFSGPADAAKIWITAAFLPRGVANKFRFLGYSILAKPLDADFASTEPRKAGIRDAKKWAKEIRGSGSASSLLHFRVSGKEISCGYIVVHFTLLAKDGTAVFGSYYLPLKDLSREHGTLPDLFPGGKK